MLNEEGTFAIVELAKKDTYLREIVSNYSTLHCYDISIFRESGFWKIESARKALENRLDRIYRGKLFEDHVAEPRVFAALLGDKQVGWIELGYEKWNNRMRVWEFLVEEDFRRRGVGRLLMNHAVKISKEKGARMLVLETQTNNDTAVSFYLNFGFELIGLDLAAYSNEDIKKKEVRLELGLKLH
jgi:ribosomal protein S18 acetylase RimI-like enzyme